jgi:hypothetical protein
MIFHNRHLVILLRKEIFFEVIASIDYALSILPSLKPKPIDYAARKFTKQPKQKRRQGASKSHLFLCHRCHFYRNTAR